MTSRPLPVLAAFCLSVMVTGCDPASATRAAASVTVELDGYAPARPATLRAAGWSTDLDRALLDVDAIRIGPVSRDAFVPVRTPRFAPAADVALDPSEPLLVHRGPTGEARAWPLAHLLLRELVLDEVDGVPVAVTGCSLCGTARAWDRTLDGEVLELGVSGLLLDGNALLYDRRTESLWRQVDGSAVAGAHAGRRLRALPTITVSLGALRAAHPEAAVMEPVPPGGEAPLARITAGHVARGVPPPWLHASCDDPLRWTLSTGDPDAVLIPDPTTAVFCRGPDGGPGPVTGSAAAFSREVDGRVLTFDLLPAGARDRETGSRWNVLGEAVEGPLRGRRLEPVPQTPSFRFAPRALGD